jgi:putative tryptophan/tyrosine transport system substrate-binding protein
MEETRAVRRRAVLSLLAGLASCPRLALAQGTPRVVLVISAPEGSPHYRAWVTAFTQTLARLGWTAPQNLALEIRSAAGAASGVPALARDIVALKPDIIVAHATPMVAALRRETSTIPIVFVGVLDPIGQGFVANPARPEGNITGFSDFRPELAQKWVEILKDILPRLTRAALLFNPDSAPFAESILRAAATVTPRLGVEIYPAPVRSADETARAIAEVARQPDSALVVAPDAFTLLTNRVIITSTATHRLPAMYPFRYFVDTGGLVAYGLEPSYAYRQAADYVDRILKGAVPRDLPVQAPRAFELIINLKTAHAMDLKIPRLVLARADEVIE